MHHISHIDEILILVIDLEPPYLEPPYLEPPYVEPDNAELSYLELCTNICTELPIEPHAELRAKLNKIHEDNAWTWQNPPLFYKTQIL